MTKPMDVQLFAGDHMPWPNSVIISGQRSVLLIDAQFFISDAKELVKQIETTGLPLTAILLTHSHPDHVWGAVEVLKAYPQAKVYARPEVAREIDLEFRGRLLRWTGVFTGEIPSELPEVHPLEDDAFDFEGHPVTFVDIFGAETIFSTGFYLPESKTYISGDHIFHKCHFYTCQLNRPDLWVRSLQKTMDDHDIERVVPGHGPIGGTELFDQAIEYLEYYGSVAKPLVPQLHIAEAMLAKYPDHTLEGVLYMTVGPGITSPEIMEKTGGKVTFGSRKPV